MKITPFFYGTFTLKRSWAAPPARVFRAWADPEIKCQWFSGPPGDWAAIRREVDFRPGGLEIHEGKFNSSGMTTLFEGRFHVIEKNERLVFAYDLRLSGHLHSVTLASLILQPNGARTDVFYTEQIVFLDGRDGTTDRKHGTEQLHFNAIEKMLLHGDGER
jgi:uncharacterized protein YndB with AHSA1/START domain